MPPKILDNLQHCDTKCSSRAVMKDLAEMLELIVDTVYTFHLKLEVNSASGLKIGRTPVQISPKTNFSIMIKLTVK